MSNLEIDIAQIHPDWMELWAPELPQTMRSAILASDRLSQRAGARVAAALGVSSLADVPVADDSSLYYQRYMADPYRALRIIGLILHARRLSQVIDGHTLRQIAGHFPIDDLNIALSCRDLVPASPNDRPVSGDDAAAMLDDAIGAVRLWLETLPDPLADRVALTLPKTVQPMDMSRFKADTQIYLVETALLALEEKTKWQIH